MTAATYDAKDGNGAHLNFRADERDEILSPVHLVGGVDYLASEISAIIGVFNLSGSSGTIAPLAGRPFNIRRGVGAGTTVILERKLPGDASFFPVTDINCNQIGWDVPVETTWTEYETGALYRLTTTSFAVATAYRLSQ